MSSSFVSQTLSRKQKMQLLGDEKSKDLGRIMYKGPVIFASFSTLP